MDSRGNPTVEFNVYVNYIGEISLAVTSSAPSGASTGSGEAYELRDKDERDIMVKEHLKHREMYQLIYLCYQRYES